MGTYCIFNPITTTIAVYVNTPIPNILLSF
jgi:hypothetical protein